MKSDGTLGLYFHIPFCVRKCPYCGFWSEGGALTPEMVIGAPVGFVNVVEAKEELMRTAERYIVARGRKGGSGVAAAIVNAALYQLVSRED